MTRASKYSAIRTKIDGITFASKKEAKRYAELKLLERARLIECLELQPRYPIMINGHVVCTYVADFAYVDKAKSTFGITVTEDVKGIRTPIYKLKKKMFEAAYPGWKITEI